MPFSPVQSALKFSTVLGTLLPYSPITMRPARSTQKRGVRWWLQSTPHALKGRTSQRTCRLAIDLNVEEHFVGDGWAALGIGGMDARKITHKQQSCEG